MRGGATLARIAALVALALTLGGCNTVQGIGKDIKAGGNAIEKAADSAKRK
jgi:predicted small secreted protein